MDVVANAYLFWAITEQTLVEVYGWDPQDAKDRVTLRRGRMTKTAIVRNIVYHNQPIHVAHDLDINMEPINEADLKKYDAIVARLRLEPISVPETEAVRSERKKPRKISVPGPLARASAR